MMKKQILCDDASEDLEEGATEVDIYDSNAMLCQSSGNGRRMFVGVEALPCEIV